MVIPANDTKELKDLITKLDEGINEYGMKINLDKTQVMRLK